MHRGALFCLVSFKGVRHQRRSNQRQPRLPNWARDLSRAQGRAAVSNQNGKRSSPAPQKVKPARHTELVLYLN